MSNLKARAWRGLLFLAMVMGLLLFGLAGTIEYWQAWAYLGVYFGGSLLILLYLLQADPVLLERRMRGGPSAEKEKAQRSIMLFASVGFIGLLVVPALDRRMHWSHVSAGITVLGDILVAAWWFIILIVFRENSFTSATIEVVSGQRVISTGPYAVVRHPMYAGGLLLVLGTPLALGSIWGLLVIAAMTPVLLMRLVNEERFLSKNLPGYKEYCARVRWRLIPGVF
jgi:protein-S-isoprenylcysteine O-methyltransferase Ste14